MKLNTLSKSVLMAISALMLAACGSDDSDEGNTHNLGPATLEIGTYNGSTIADTKNIPIPNDLYIYEAKDTSQKIDPEFWELETYADTHHFQNCTADTNDTKCSLTEIDGWSTTAPFTIPVSGDVTSIDLATLVEGVKLFKESNQDGDKAAIGALEEVTYRETFEDVVVGEQAYTVRVTSFGAIQVLPLSPLDPETTYVVAITSDLKTTDGETILTNGGYADLKSAPTAVENSEAYIYDKAFADHTANVETALNLDGVLYAASFTTQSVGLDIDSTGTKVTLTVDSSNTRSFKLGDITNPGLVVDPTNCGDSAGQVDCVNKASSTLRKKIEVDLPYYFELSTVDGSNCSADVANFTQAQEWFELNGANSHYESYLYTKDNCDNLFSSWDGNTSEVITSDINVVFPHDYDGVTELPVVIFIHGITAVKELGNGGMLILDNFLQEYIADTGLQGHLVIAMDHHMHGSRAYDFNGDGIAEVNASASVRGLYPGNDNADVKNFLKADALLTSRDNFRQAVADVINLRTGLSSATLSEVKIDTDNVKLVGHSMGAIIAATATGILNSDSESTNDISRTVLANPGAGIAGLVFNSTWLGKDEVPPSIKLTDDFQDRVKEKVEERTGESPRDLLAWAQANKATYDSIVAEIEPAFMSEFQYLIQSVVDTVDPLNYVDVLKQSNVLSITVDGTIEDGIKPSENNEVVTTGDQTVPVKIELDTHTMFERCNGLDTEEFGAQARCALGTTDQAYYELNLTEFPLAGAYPLETLIGMENVKGNGNAPLVYSRLSVGTHNIGVGTMTETTAAEGNADSALVGKAAALVADQAAKFVAGEDAYNVVNNDIIK
ncbi:hypothetical protein F0231_17780 [Vibrio sp. RE86]|uniref:hypothetical protein n=1 Tax=Vibrio sp. RE86 TaxID=2607605 RepID=UPI0014937375|nr:hypothetical protein [Vibrio sp. RE86]NOH81592.1 hypothetical protein [Vibrio sp. RE86]